MKANGVKSDNQVAVLLTAIGPETNGLLRILLTPEKPDARSHEELVEILNSHLHSKPLVIAEPFNFHNRLRNDSESVADFAAQLKKPRNFQKKRERSPKVRVIVVGTLSITVLSVNIRNIGVMHVVKWVI